MKSYHEIANRVFERRDKHIAMQKRKKRIIISIVTPALCGIVIITILTLWKSGMFDSNLPVKDNTQKMSHNSPTENKPNDPVKPSEDTPATIDPSEPPAVDTDYNIDSIDKINFYSAKKIISENSLFPFGMRDDLSSSPRMMLLNKTYAEYPIDRDKTFTTTMVTYFTVELNNENGFLAQKLGGTGLVEIVVTENDVEDMGQMITFKRDDNYYTCFMNGQHNDRDSDKVSREFSSHKYIEGFNVVKNLEQENYKFTVHYEGSKVIGFACAPFHSVPTEYVADDVTFLEDFCVVLYTKQTFTIDELEVYFNNESKKEPLVLTRAYTKPKAVML